MALTHVQYNWSVMWETTAPVDYPHKGHAMWSFDISFVVSLKKLFNKQLSWEWFQIPWCSCDITMRVIRWLLVQERRNSITNALELHLSCTKTIPDSKVHGANMGPTWVLSAPDGPHVGPMNLAIRDWYVFKPVILDCLVVFMCSAYLDTANANIVAQGL